MFNNEFLARLSLITAISCSLIFSSKIRMESMLVLQPILVSGRVRTCKKTETHSLALIRGGSEEYGLPFGSRGMRERSWLVTIDDR